LKLYFAAKSTNYLGFNPSTISPTDPNYFMKLSSTGQFLANPSGWNTYYQDIAATAQNAAQQSATLELVASGLKTPRDISTVSISKSINSIISAEKAGFQNLIQLGISNAESIISQVVAKLTQNLLNQFVFAGLT